MSKVIIFTCLLLFSITGGDCFFRRFVSCPAYKLKGVYNKLIRCGEQVIPVVKTENFRGLLLGDKSAIESTCGILTDVTTCLQKELKDTNCINEPFKELIVNATYGLLDGIKYLCEDEARRVYEFISEGGFRCFINLENKIESCNQIERKRLMKAIVGNEKNFKNNFCKISSSKTDCMINLMTSSEHCNEKIVKLMQGFSDVINKNFSC